MGNDEPNEPSLCGVRANATTVRAGLLSCALAVGLLGCSSSDRPTPREQCLDYQNAYCDKANECAEPSERADLSESCQFLWQVYSYCDRVTVVLPPYDACMQALHAIACSNVESGSFPDFPEECRGIFAVSP